jgi:hypothetical protein
MSLIQKIVAFSNKVTRSMKVKLYSDLPVRLFEDKHLAHLVSLKDRSTLLEHLPKNGTVAEIGVNEGDFSEKILSVCQPSKLILIDVWASKRYHGGLFEKVKNRFASQMSQGKIEIMRDYSFGAIAACPDAYFDWVYLDTDHMYETTRRELELLRTKMKPGGIIAGHDYAMGNWNGGVRYGVMEAVREFCLTYDWEMIFITHEIHDHPSFAIRAIQ